MLSGCQLLPEMSRQPQFHNPFPQLSKVAVAPFFNLTNEPTLDGRKVAIAYFNELQSVPGFEVVPVGVVETAMHEHQDRTAGAAEARRLAQILKVDAVVIGAVTDYFPYYPPRMALQVEWYSANPGFHPIPPGYGLPWGTSEEKDIPAPLVFEAEMALAKAQMKTQTPAAAGHADRGTARGSRENSNGNLKHSRPMSPLVKSKPTWPEQNGKSGATGAVFRYGRYSRYKRQKSCKRNRTSARLARSARIYSARRLASRRLSLPSNAPVLRHTRTYNGNDMEFTTALSSYYAFRDDARFGGWQSYLNRSDDFIRFCCHMHISEMLTARGGAGESRLVWRWPNIR